MRLDNLIEGRRVSKGLSLNGRSILRPINQLNKRLFQKRKNEAHFTQPLLFAPGVASSLQQQEYFPRLVA